MAVAHKTYSFRAPGEFGDRLQQVRDDFSTFMRDAELSAHLGNEFELALLRRLRELGEEVPDGVFVRAIAEAFVSASECVRREQEQLEAFAAFAHDDAEADAWRRAGGRLLADRIAREES